MSHRLIMGDGLGEFGSMRKVSQIAIAADRLT